jgi:hypothetical protein
LGNSSAHKLQPEMAAPVLSTPPVIDVTAPGSSGLTPFGSAYASTRHAECSTEASEMRDIFVSTLDFCSFVRNSLQTFKPHLLNLTFPLMVHAVLELMCFDDIAAQALDIRGLDAVCPLIIPAVRRAVVGDKRAEGSAEDAEEEPAAKFANALTAARLLLEAAKDDFLPMHAHEIAALGLLRPARPTLTGLKRIPGDSNTAAATSLGLQRQDRRQALATLTSSTPASWIAGSEHIPSRASALFGNILEGADGAQVDLSLISRLLNPSLKYRVTIPSWPLRLALEYLTRKGYTFLMRTLNAYLHIEMLEIPVTSYFSSAAPAGDNALPPADSVGSASLPMQSNELVAGIVRTADVQLAVKRLIAPGADTYVDPMHWGVPFEQERTAQGIRMRAFTGPMEMKTILYPDYSFSALGRAIASACGSLPARVKPAEAGADGNATVGSKRPRADFSDRLQWDMDELRTVQLRCKTSLPSACMRLVAAAKDNGGLTQVVVTALRAGGVQVWATIDLSPYVDERVFANGRNNELRSRTLVFTSSKSSNALGQVTSVDISQCGTFILCGCSSGRVALFTILPQLQSCVRSALAKLLRTGVALAAGTFDAGSLPDIDDSSLTFTIEPLSVYQHSLSGAVWSVSFCKLTPKIFVSGGRDATAKLWSTADEIPQLIFAGHLSDVSTVSIHANGMYTITGSDDGSMRVWDNVSSECLRLCVGHKARITALAPSPSGRFVATGDAVGVVRLWELGSGSCVVELRGHQQLAPITTMLFHVRGKRLATGDAKGRVCLWDIGIHKFSGPSLAISQSTQTEGVSDLHEGVPRCFCTSISDVSDTLVCLTTPIKSEA